MKRLTRLLCVCLLAWPLWAQAISVVFINPGKSDEIYWLTATRAMEAAAKSLDLEFEVFYAERQHPRVIGIARDIIARPRHPDFVVFSNDYATAPELLRMFDAAGIKTFLAYSGIAESADRAASGHPRERYKGWLGALEPHADEAGYLTARELIAKGRAAGLHARDGKLHLLAIAGDRSKPSKAAAWRHWRAAISSPAPGRWCCCTTIATDAISPLTKGWRSTNRCSPCSPRPKPDAS